MALTLKLNRGASYTTINLNDGTNYCTLDPWNPRIAPRKVAQFGGNPYKDVIESIPLKIKGTTAAVVLEKLEDILAAMEQAFAWKLGATVDPVLFEYLPNGSSLGAVLQAAVLGTPADAADMLELAQLAMYMTGNSFETIITLPLWRRGELLGASETPAASSAVTNPGKMSVTFATSRRIPSPVKLVFDPDPAYGLGTPDYHQGYVLWADVADKIQILDSASMSPTGGVGAWDTVANTTALGGNVRRTDVSSAPTGIGGSMASMNADARMFAFFANVQNLSSTYSWIVTPQIGAGTLIQGRPVVLSPSGDYPLLTFLGYLVGNGALGRADMLVESNGATLDADGLEVDYFLLMAVDEFTGALTFDDFETTFGTPNLDALTVDPAVLTKPNGFMSHDGQPFKSTKGAIHPLSVGTNLTAVVAGTYPAGGAGSYSLRHPAGILDFSLTATRYPGYLVAR